MKTCTKCGETKPTTEFHKNSSKRDGLYCHCKLCSREARVNRYNANSEKAKQSAAAYRSAKPEKVKATKAAWAKSNPEKNRSSCAKWRAANKLARRILDNNRNARKRVAGGKLSKDIADKLITLQRGKCACCGQLLGNDYHLDHIMPLKLGGTNTDDNMQLLRATCNLQKNAKHPVDFMQQRGFLI